MPSSPTLALANKWGTSTSGPFQAWRACRENPLPWSTKDEHHAALVSVIPLKSGQQIIGLEKSKIQGKQRNLHYLYDSTEPVTGSLSVAISVLT